MIFEEVHPGRILKRELEARDLSAAALALKLRIAPQRVQEIVTGKRAISPESSLSAPHSSWPCLAGPTVDSFTVRFNAETQRRGV